MTLPFDDFVAFVAPFPRQGSVVEGWQSRIRAVDGIFIDVKRVYLNFDEGAARDGQILAEKHAHDVVEYRLNPSNDAHREFVRLVITQARLVYVHTIHWARYVLLFYPTGALVTDIHGVVPEEEAMLGRPHTGALYEIVERFVLMNSTTVVVVSESMRRHLLKKYPDCAVEFIVLPIIEKYPLSLSDRVDSADEEKPRVIYSGAAQVWQNIDQMLDVCRRSIGYFDFHFFSHESELIRQKAAALGIADSITFEVRKKEAMPSAYLRADYGFVLRDDVVVNRVACPTKLSEYLQFGVIPVVDLVDIGDLGEEGYAYITHHELAAGVVPELTIAQDMRRHNKAVIDRIALRFEAGAGRLRELVARAPNLGKRFAGLLEANRYLLFPSHADFYAFSEPLCFGRTDVVDEYNSIGISLRELRPARSFRFVPFMANCEIAIRRLVIEHDESDAPASVTAVHITGEPSQASWRLKKEAPHIDFETSSPIRVHRFRAEVKFVSTGAVDGSDKSERPQIQPIEFETIQGKTVRRDRVMPRTTG